jgi:hypothetical protein
MRGSIYLRMPCVKKIKPTARRINIILRAFKPGVRSDFSAYMDVAQVTPESVPILLASPTESGH